MSRPFDVTTKELLASGPEPWLAYLGVVAAGPVVVIDADLSTVTAEADKVFRVGGPQPYLVHIEVQTSGDLTLPRRLWRYNALLDLRFDLRVRSVAVLLRPEADRPNLTGVLDLRLPDGGRVGELYYTVVRVWQRPVEPILAGELGLLPMAALADIPREAVAGIIDRVVARLVREAPVAQAGKMIEATLVLAGLRLNESEIEALRGRFRMMDLINESSYLRLAVKEGREEGLREGKIEEARRMILRQGQIRFGPAEDAVRHAVGAIAELDRLEGLCDRLLVVSSWDELMAEGPREPGTTAP